MQTKSLTHTVAQFSEAIAITLSEQVSADDVIVFVSDFSDSTSFTISEGRSNGYYARYFTSV